MNIAESKETKETKQEEATAAKAESDAFLIEESLDEHFSDESGEEDYSDDGGDEGEEGYRPGGYHPVEVGQRYHTRYTILQKLGWGHFSTVWMVHDKKYNQPSQSTREKLSESPEYVALKIQKSAPHYREAAVDEIELLRCVKDAASGEEVWKEFGSQFKVPVVQLTDHFDHSGPNGKHKCMVFEMLGENLLEVIKKFNYKGIPLPIVRHMAKEICLGLDFLHRHCEIIHTDLKPENLVIATPPNPPSKDEVQSILAAGNPQNRKKKKKKSGGGQQQSGDANRTIDRTIEALTKELSSSQLNPEQRKKLKKKLKKKKQQAKKKDKKRQGKRNRRNDRPGAIEGGGSSLSVEKANRAEIEARMMERDSNRIGGSQAASQGVEEFALARSKSTSPECRGADFKADSKDVETPSKLSYDSNSKEDSKGGDKEFILDGINIGMGGLSLEDKHSSDSKDKEGSDNNAVLNTSQVSAAFPDPPLEVGMPDPLDLEEVRRLMPPWLRATWFSFVNFSGEEVEGMEDADLDIIDTAAGDIEGVKKGAASKTYDIVRPISCADWVDFTGSNCSKITMLLSTRRMIEIFGSPDEDKETPADGDHKDLLFGDWFFSFADPSGETKHGADGVDESSNSDSALQFVIRGHGPDNDHITALVGLCVLNSLAYESEQYYLADVEDVLDKPVIWNIIHDASMTENVCAYMEKRVSGLKFLAHYDVPEAISEQDDEELLYVMRQLSVHPCCEATCEHEEEEHEDERGQVADLDKWGGAARDGCGAVVGIDVDALSKAVHNASEPPDLPESERRTYDITGYVYPLSRRMRFFRSERAQVESTMLLYNRIHQTLATLGEGSQDSMEDGGEIEESEQLARLHEQYTDCGVKIVDLGNACWTYKHFTEDIQTRQYRCPEVLLGAPYGCAADMWSFACVVFELLTGDLLFDPRAGTKWDREEDHLAMMIELLGDFPKDICGKGKRASDYFTTHGELINIQQLKYWPLQDVLKDKYRFPEEDANEIANFLLPMLKVDPGRRITAVQALGNPFIRDV